MFCEPQLREGPEVSEEQQESLTEAARGPKFSRAPRRERSGLTSSDPGQTIAG